MRLRKNIYLVMRIFFAFIVWFELRIKLYIWLIHFSKFKNQNFSQVEILVNKDYCPAEGNGLFLFKTISLLS